MTATPSASETGPMNVGVWLPAESAAVFRRHVPKKRRSDWGRDAIEERLRREGAFDDKQKAAEAIKAVPAAAVPLLSKLGELVESLGPAVVEAKLEELVGQEIAAAGNAGQ